MSLTTPERHYQMDPKVAALYQAALRLKLADHMTTDGLFGGFPETVAAIEAVTSTLCASDARDADEEYSLALVEMAKEIERSTT